MKLIQTITLAAIVLFLAACTNNDETQQNSGSATDNVPSDTLKTTDHGVEDKSDVGFEMSGNNIEEAENIPKQEKSAIIAAFDEYMAAFNEEDIDRYMKSISKKPEGFNYDTEKADVQDVFKQFDTIRTAENVTIVKYDETHAQVFAQLNVALEQESTGAKLDSKGRQVTVFAKEEGKWLVTSVYFIRDTTE
ncbi:DUF4440 domain-containing protein [Psychrobacillus sp.]|uniref:nuclear transport factor 2 family protein n=1 Tax=Psychrobacillus sp. TaxID=1871623 RepID=UPI0028BD745A|nr:nuclear transport factor 2 family protein [Psychrobacillus sp.]